MHNRYPQVVMIKTLSALCLRKIVDDFYTIWTNLPDETANQNEDILLIKLTLLSSVRQKLCMDKRLLAWYLLNGLADLKPFTVIANYDEWTDTTPEIANRTNFTNYNNWTLTSISRARILDKVLGRASYDDWNFKHPLPPDNDELDRWLSDARALTLLHINGVTYDLEWLLLK